jgi:putative transposase
LRFDGKVERGGIDRTLAWLNRNRRLAKEFEKAGASAFASLLIAFVLL